MKVAGGELTLGSSFTSFDGAGHLGVGVEVLKLFGFGVAPITAVHVERHGTFIIPRRDMAGIAELRLEGPKNSEIPLFIGTHDLFRLRISYYRSIAGVDQAGFKPPPDEKPEEEWTDEEAIRVAVAKAFKKGFPLVAIGRAQDGETVEEAKAKIIAQERVIRHK